MGAIDVSSERQCQRRYSLHIAPVGTLERFIGFPPRQLGIPQQALGVRVPCLDEKRQLLYPRMSPEPIACRTYSWDCFRCP